MRIFNSFMVFVILLLVSGVLLGCVEVKPWQKQSLGRSHMAFDPDPLESRYNQHVFQSKEGSSGGYGPASGGCGCN